MATIAMIVSAATDLTLADGSAHPTGYWAEEVSESYRVLTEAGHRVDVVTPSGTVPTVDPISLDGRGGVDPADGERFAAALAGIVGLAAPLDLATISAGDYDALYLPGGHGPMADLARDADLGRLLVAAVDSGTLVAALCHGPAGLLSAIRPDGSFALAGRRLTVFSNEEEATGGLGDAAPYLVGSELERLGAVVAAGPAWGSNVVVDRAGDSVLVTGQNPGSSVATAQAVVAQLASA